MKGGKKGREPKSGGSRQGSGRDKPKPTAGKRAAGSPPKGSRKRPGYGGSSSTGEE